jgi:predicted Zn-dependent protease
VKQTEVEADRLSVYLLEAATYGTEGAESFWARWGRAHDWGIFATGSHPGWKQRIAIIRAESARIANFRQTGVPVTVTAELMPRD